ncbi:MAG: ABC transporter permease [Eubacterium sp.]|nr:ABC transporter permease [Eubacterium sp.]
MKTINNLLSNCRIVWNLAINDFKTKYAGSQFGFLWAFVQPIVTIIIYIFVFQVIAKAPPLENDFPFVLWLIAGMVPWFYFSESITNGTSSLIEYSYLVKKVVFKVSLLPIVRVVSSIFVHLFFVLFCIVVYIINGIYPSVYYLEILYYLICMIALCIGISYITASIMPFFKDFSQLVNILLMIGMWVCPVMWNYKTILPEKYVWIFRLNPVFYIVQGYRDAFIDHMWFWERPLGFVIFWVTTIVIILIGYRMFKKLSIHFADVL